ncbi:MULTISPECIES: TetR/AcrR family transcriptional regulator [Dietzia]|uniref:TetR/AcrR family transcriptional regulator n=3 Tax=Dietzia TaxID=37914 RepID=A0ABT8H4A3_9ACTN|nr:MULTISPECIES: TetR/AcrR family transcriptional regulator [Dietzia]MBB0990385.1 TetR/AcrR family transcriptional regulator [Dietzia sp. SLG510A3-30A2]MBB0993637.1 TetR/AcrR family transcriptional regulator [Dietzia sp. SLG510A3-40A3]MBB1008323.1 TetR/AcrR family transcriptional regulator [Dietzia sp. SLG510A3-3B2-2]HBD21374.1 TetR/AcrR family transcriptional regulator [Dietzia sp.]MBB0996171.1 TetR/AcrR family transcriptional regulator [Dietzia maris]
MTPTREPGRRELNKADKQRRIHAAARDLFTRRGYSSVTTQEVADLAEVGTGTLFRYAQSKGELLCMVANDEFRAMVETVPATGDPVNDLVTLCEPLLVALDRQPENIAAYHRETLFGEPGPHRAEAQRILGELRDLIAGVLAGHSGTSATADDLAGPAQTVFDVLYMTIVRCGVERSPVSDSRGTVTEQVRHVLYGVLPPAATGSDRPHPPRCAARHRVGRD